MKIKMQWIVIPLSLCGVLCGVLGCSGGSGGNKGSGSHTDSYEYIEGDFSTQKCTTHEQTFSANSTAELREQVCTALMDDERNNHCAAKKRVARFREECSGTEAEKALNKDLNSGNQTELSPQAPFNEPAPNSPNSTPQPEPENPGPERFAKSKVSGEHSWNPSSLKLTFHRTDNKTKKTKTRSAVCKSSTPITLTTNYPSLALNMGFFECKDKAGDLPTDIKVTFFQIIRHLNYNIRHLPDITPENQFSLNVLEFDRNIYLSGSYMFDTIQSLNSNVIGDNLYLDLMITTLVRDSVFLVNAYKNQPSFYMTAKLGPDKNGELNDLRIEMTIDTQVESTKIEFGGDLSR